MSQLDLIFPEPTSIPADHALTRPLEQTEYLVDGVLREGSGPREEVLSPICRRQAGGLEQVRLGSYPLLEAFRDAFPHGVVCRVNINCQCQRGPDTFPFTGRKDSAEGTLSVSDALRVFSIRTLVAAKRNDLNQDLLTRIVREHKSRFLSTDFIF